MVYWILKQCSMQYPLFEKHKESSRINPNISNYREFLESMVLILVIKSYMTSKYGTNLFIIIRHYKWEDWNWWRSRVCSPPPRLLPQKHVPITLAGIPYLVSYTLESSISISMWTSVNFNWPYLKQRGRKVKSSMVGNSKEKNLLQL